MEPNSLVYEINSHPHISITRGDVLSEPPKKGFTWIHLQGDTRLGYMFQKPPEKSVSFLQVPVHTRLPPTQPQPSSPSPLTLRYPTPGPKKSWHTEISTLFEGPEIKELEIVTPFRR